MHSYRLRSLSPSTAEALLQNMDTPKAKSRHTSLSVGTQPPSPAKASKAFVEKSIQASEDKENFANGVSDSGPRYFASRASSMHLKSMLGSQQVQALSSPSLMSDDSDETFDSPNPNLDQLSDDNESGGEASASSDTFVTPTRTKPTGSALVTVVVKHEDVNQAEDSIGLGTRAPMENAAGTDMVLNGTTDVANFEGALSAASTSATSRGRSDYDTSIRTPERDHYDRTIKKYRNEESRLRAENFQMKESLAHFQEQVTELQGDVDVLHRKCKGSKSKIKQLHRVYEEKENDLRDRLGSAQDEIVRLTEKTLHIEELQNQCNDLKRRNDALDSDYNGLLEDLDFTESLGKELQEKCEGLMAELQTIRVELDGKTARVADLEEEVEKKSRLEEKVKESAKVVEGLKKERSNLERLLRESQDANKGLGDGLDSCKKRCLDLEGKVSEIEARCNESSTKDSGDNGEQLQFNTDGDTTNLALNAKDSLGKPSWGLSTLWLFAIFLVLVLGGALKQSQCHISELNKQLESANDNKQVATELGHLYNHRMSAELKGVVLGSMLESEKVRA